MTQPRWAAASKRAPDHLERHPEWTAPRLLRRTSSAPLALPPPTGSVPAPQERRVPPPPSDPDPGIRKSARIGAAPQHALPLPLAASVAERWVSPSLALPASSHTVARAGFGSLVSLLVISALGVVTGTGTASLIALKAPATAARIAAPLDAAVSIFSGSSNAVTATEARRSITVALPPAAGDSDLEALLQRARGELAAQNLEQPSGDNALGSYRQLKAKWPEDKRVAELGGAIGAVFWSRANAARSAGNWGEALHYFELVNALPPLALGSSPPRAAASPRAP